MFPVRISQGQVFSLKRKFWSCFVQLDCCNLAFFPTRIPEQPLPHTPHNCLWMWAALPSTWLHWNGHYWNSIPSSKWSRSTHKCHFPTQFVYWPVFVLPANTLRCWNSSRDGIFLLVLSATTGRWEINSGHWAWLGSLQEEHVIRAASAPQSAPLAAHPTLCRSLHMESAAEQVP